MSFKVKPGSAVSVSGQQSLLLLRGFPGAGKSTFGNLLTQGGFYFFEADQWRGEGAERLYNDDYNVHAHAWCLGSAADRLRQGHNVAVGNTFSEIAKLHPYFMLARELKERGRKISVTVLHVQGPIGRSIHTEVDYARYTECWETYEGQFDLGK